MIPITLHLDLRPAAETPTEEGDYLILNPCDGYHLVEGWFDDDGTFEGFRVFGQTEELPQSFYVAWARLPDSAALSWLVK